MDDSSRKCLQLTKSEFGFGHGVVWSGGGLPPWAHHCRLSANSHWPCSQQPVSKIKGCLRIELVFREMDQPLTRPPCFPLTGVVLLSASNGFGHLGVGWIHHDRLDEAAPQACRHWCPEVCLHVSASRFDVAVHSHWSAWMLTLIAWLRPRAPSVRARSVRRFTADALGPSTEQKSSLIERVKGRHQVPLVALGAAMLQFQTEQQSRLSPGVHSGAQLLPFPRGAFELRPAPTSCAHQQERLQLS